MLGDQRPHPADTAADDQVRSRIVAQLRQIGLQPVVREQFSCNELFKQRGVSCARVRNVIAVLGPPSGKAILLNAHYDSVALGPGASDDGAGVATLLEIASILENRPLKRPVILLFNEGEELGLVGARAFLADPLSRNVDSLINLEARGVRGPVNMFETSRPNAAPIALYGEAVKRPVANSLSTDVYRLMPNYTDVNSLSERGWLTLNLAPIGNEMRYHSAGDDLGALDAATLQHMGNQTLALTERLAASTTPAGGADRIFMDLAGRALIELPLWVGAVVLAALLVAFTILAIRGGAMIRGVGVTAGTLAGSAALSWLALALIGGLRHGTFWRAEPIWTCLGAYASALLAAVILLSIVGRGAEVRQLRTSFWLVYLIAGLMIGLFAPGGIIFFLFPPLLALSGLIGARWWRAVDRIGAVLAIVSLYLTWGAMLGLLEELLNQGPMWLFAPLGSFVILPILIEARPLIGTARLRPAVAIAAVLALVSWAAAATAPAYSADRQQRFVIEHVADASSGRSWWAVINDRSPLPRPYRSVGAWTRGKLPFSDRPRWIVSARPDPSSRAPAVQIVSEVRNGAERTLTLRLAANGNESVDLIAAADSRIRSAGLPGSVRPIDQSAEGQYSIDCEGRGCEGFILQLVIGQPKPIDFIVLGTRGQLPASAAPLLANRPRFARPQYNRDESIVFTRARL